MKEISHKLRKNTGWFVAYLVIMALTNGMHYLWYDYTLGVMRTAKKEMQEQEKSSRIKNGGEAGTTDVKR